MEAGKRPKFSDLVIIVSDLLERDAGYLELSPLATYKMATMSSLPPAPPEMELREMAVLQPEVEGKEDINDN